MGASRPAAACWCGADDGRPAAVQHVGWRTGCVPATGTGRMGIARVTRGRRAVFQCARLGPAFGFARSRVGIATRAGCCSAAAGGPADVGRAAGSATRQRSSDLGFATCVSGRSGTGSGLGRAAAGGSARATGSGCGGRTRSSVLGRTGGSATRVESSAGRAATAASARGRAERALVEPARRAERVGRGSRRAGARTRSSVVGLGRARCGRGATATGDGRTVLGRAGRPGVSGSVGVGCRLALVGHPEDRGAGRARGAFMGLRRAGCASASASRADGRAPACPRSSALEPTRGAGMEPGRGSGTRCAGIDGRRPRRRRPGIAAARGAASSSSASASSRCPTGSAVAEPDHERVRRCRDHGRAPAGRRRQRRGRADDADARLVAGTGGASSGRRDDGHPDPATGPASASGWRSAGAAQHRVRT